MINTSTLSKFFKRKSIRYAVPFVVFVVGGAVGLSEFTSLRYQYRTNGNRQEFLDVREKLEKDGIVIKKLGEVTLESEYEKLKEMDIDNWENKRIWRPWEDEEFMTKQ